jgi:hypothetical protein
MPRAGRCLVVAAVVLGLAAPAARAADRCIAKAVIGGNLVTLLNCAISFYDSENGVTIWLTEAPLSDDEVSKFQLNSSPEEKDASGRRRTMIYLAFCPGGGKPTPSPDAVKTVEMSLNHASSPLLGMQWVFDLPKDKANLKLEKLSGDLKLGGRLAGKITGARTADEKPYSWDIDFDVALPAKAAAAGPACGP